MKDIILIGILLLYLNITVYSQSIEKAWEFYNKGEVNKAIKICNQILKKKELSPYILIKIGEIYVRSKKSPDIIQKGWKLLELAVKKSPTFEIKYKVAKISDNLNNFKLAIKYYQECLKYYKDPKIYHSLSLLYEEIGDYKRALEYKSKCVALVLPYLRGLKFKKEVKVNTQTKEQLKKTLIKEFDKELPPEKAYSMEETLKAFKLIPENCKIREIMLNLLVEQVAGFYNPDTKYLCLIGEKPKKSFWERLLGLRRDDTEERVVIAHEMTHSLQDQYFNINKTEEKLKKNDDRLLAFQCLLEGDATLTMIDYRNNQYIQDNNIKLHYFLTNKDIPSIEMTFKIMSFLLPFMGGKEFSKTPYFLRELLIFPYIAGLKFCLYLRNNNKANTIEELNTNINKAFKKLPASSEQILHPYKYLYNIDKPLDCNLPNLSPFFGKNWKELENNVMGEIGIKLMLENFKIENAKKIAQGWGGDRYSVLKNEKLKKRSIIWLTYWDTFKDATQFFEGYYLLLKKKYNYYKNWKIKEFGIRKREILLKDKNKILYLCINNQKVIILENIPKNIFLKLLKKLLKIKFKVVNIK